MEARPSRPEALPPAAPAIGWWTPEGEPAGLATYVEAIRAGRWIIVGALLACLAAAGLYLASAEKVYEASADLLVTPIELEYPVPGTLVPSGDPTRDTSTVAELADDAAVARRVIEELSLDTSARGVLNDVEAAPVAESNIVTITAQAGTAQGATALADAFAQEFVEYRTERFHATLDGIIEQVQAEVDQAPGAAEDPGSPVSRLGVLQQLRGADDPNVDVVTLAEVPTSAVSPRPLLTLAAASVGGLIVGLVGAFGLQLLDPRLRREEQIRAQFRLPILARVPVEKRRAKKRPLLPSELSLGALDGYQALRASLGAARRDTLSGRVVLVTGPSPGDGKTTTAINLASTLAAAGKRVILIEADSRRPSIGRTLEMRADVGLASVVTGRRYLVDALLPVGGEDSKLRVLLNSPEEAPAADVLSHVSADTLLLQAQRLADWVIVDSPPLNHVAETLALARAVEDVVIVVRIGRTNRRDLTELAEMLAQQDIMPAGFVVLGGHARVGYY